MMGRQIGAAAAILLGGLGCMKADRLVAVQLNVVQADALPIEIDGGVDVAVVDAAIVDVAVADVAIVDAAVGVGPFRAPTEITGLVSDPTTTDIHGASLTQDELEIYFACQLKGESNFHIWRSTRTASDPAWKLATQVNDIVGVADDVDPDVSGDGLTLYFASNRSGAGLRLYVSQRQTRDETWGQPSEIQELTSPTLDRYGPSVDPSGRFMFFGSASRDDNNYRLYSASRTDTSAFWGNVQDLSINTGTEDNDPAIFHDLRSLIWSSRGPSNGASWDLVEVSRPDPSRPFSGTLIPLETLNTSYSERYPWVSQDGTHIVFSREAVGGPGVLYEAWR
jgi:WD40-like Beta Propeller Repeat